MDELASFLKIQEYVIDYFKDNEKKNGLNIGTVIKRVSAKHNIDSFLTKKAVWYLLYTYQIVMLPNHKLSIARKDGE